MLELFSIGTSTEADTQRDYSGDKLEFDNMFIFQRCNYAGPLGKLIPTRSWLASLAHAFAHALASTRRLRR